MSLYAEYTLYCTVLYYCILLTLNFAVINVLKINIAELKPERAAFFLMEPEHFGYVSSAPAALT
jgi:hypothetical protein